MSKLNTLITPSEPSASSSLQSGVSLTSEAAAISNYEVLDTAPEVSFDDVVALAAQICAAPIALVSLVDAKRLWFKARVGFEPSESALDNSVCRHVVAERRTIVIPDLRLDARTAFNPLVIEDNGIRFYAGVPLVTRYGIVGALCIIDVVPRADGLTNDQQSALERLARQVVALLEMRRDAIDLRKAIESRDGWRVAQEVSERRWRDLYRQMDTGFIYARVIRGDDGRINDWRYEEVNDAWGRLVGISPDKARGKTIRQMIPGIEDGWVSELAQVVETRQPYHFTRQVGAFSRWYDGTAQWVGGDDFTIIFHEVTARVEDIKRRNALLALNDALRERTDAVMMIDEASETIGIAVDASRASFGELDHTREVVKIAKGWSQLHMPPIEGSYRFDDYGDLREALLEGQVIVVNDTAVDSRTADRIDVWHALKAIAVVIVPVRERERTTAILLAHKDQPHAWTSDEVAFLRNAADRLETANTRWRDEERQDVINNEIAHRLKNTLSMVQAIAMQTLRGDASAEGLDAFTRRLQALARAHDTLIAGQWRAATLGDVVSNALDGLGASDRCMIEGPRVEMGAPAVLSTSLLIHELATNAIKYGSLSVAGGKVALDWRLTDSGDDRRLQVNWQEQGGPAAKQPTVKGFGSRLIRLGLIGTGGSTVCYEPTGFNAAFQAMLVEVERV